MAKRNTNKKNRSLRREIEILKAQLSSEKPLDSKPEPARKNVSIPSKEVSVAESVDHQVIKQDLIKSAVLAVFGFGIIAILWVYENNILIRLTS